MTIVQDGGSVVYDPEPPVLDPDRKRDETEVAEEVRETWLRGAMDMIQAGREVPVRELPADLGDAAVLSSEATSGLYRRASTRRYVVNVDIAALERKRQERLAEVRRLAELELEKWIAGLLQNIPGHGAGE